MITTHFRSLKLVGAAALATLGFYLVAQRVASERAEVEALDRQILMAKIDIRKLKTELDTRSRLPVLEQWNSNVLALSAPEADQYLHGEVQLASFTAPAAAPPRVEAVAAEVEASREVPRVQLASATRVEPQAERAIPREKAEAPKARAERPAEAAAPMLRQANYVKPSDGSFDAPARRVALLDDGVLSDLQKTAQREKRGAKPAR